MGEAERVGFDLINASIPCAPPSALSDVSTCQHALALMMVNFMCQLDWAIRCPDIWSNTVLRASVKVFLDEIKI